MKSKVFIILTLLLLIVSGNLLAETKQSQFGYVDVANVMLLHPTMRYFDPISKRFELEALKGVNTEERIEENKIRIRKEINKVEENIKELEGKRKEIQEIYLERVEKYGNSEKKLSSKELDKKAELDTKYYDDLEEIRRKIIYENENLKNLEKSSAYTGYATVGETSQLFSLMLDDVYDGMRNVAKKKNIDFVFNSSAEISFLEDGFNSPNQMRQFFDNFKETLKNPEGKVIIGGAIASWLNERNSVFINCMDRRLTNYVMMGGYDLTTDVIDYIYEKYKIGREQRDFIKEYFKRIVEPNK